MTDLKVVASRCRRWSADKLIEKTCRVALEEKIATARGFPRLAKRLNTVKKLYNAAREVRAFEESRALSHQ